MAIRYQIIIKKIETDIPYTESSYKQIFSDETWAGMTMADRAKAGDHQYGYVEHPSTKDVTIDLFDQSVDELDVAGVVAVVNGLHKEVK